MRHRVRERDPIKLVVQLHCHKREGPVGTDRDAGWIIRVVEVDEREAGSTDAGREGVEAHRAAPAAEIGYRGVGAAREVRHVAQRGPDTGVADCPGTVLLVRSTTARPL